MTRRPRVALLVAAGLGAVCLMGCAKKPDDGAIRQAAAAAIEAEGFHVPKGSAIDVKAEEGWVTLEGSVLTAEERDRAAAVLTEKVPGIKGVVNNLELNPCDQRVVDGIEGALAAVKPHASVTYTVDDLCHVTLEGWAGSEELVASLTPLMEAIPRVQGVTNRVEVRHEEKPAATPAATPARGRLIWAVYFDENATVIRDESRDVLARVAEVFKVNPKVVDVEVRGHADPRERGEDAMRLSKERAAAVRGALTALGVSPDRIRTSGLGAARPVAPSDTADRRAENRRVEFEFRETPEGSAQ